MMEERFHKIEEEREGWNVLQVHSLAHWQLQRLRERLPACLSHSLSPLAPPALFPSPLAAVNRALPGAALGGEDPSVCCHLLHTAVNRSRGGLVSAEWFPGGRFLMGCAKNGDIALWDGNWFNYLDTKTLVHMSGVCTVTRWTRSGTRFITGDQKGLVQLSTQSLTPLTVLLELEGSPVSAVSPSPSDAKLLGVSPDAFPVVWDIETASAESRLQTRGYDIGLADWHPSKSLVATGSRTRQVHLWDPRNTDLIAEVSAHRGPLSALAWHPTSEVLLVTAGKDATLKVWDLRDISSPLASVLVGPPVVAAVGIITEAARSNGRTPSALHLDSLPSKVVETASSAVSSVHASEIAFHPTETNLMAVGDSIGGITHWNVEEILMRAKGHEVSADVRPVARVDCAHDVAVLKLVFHPLGIALVSCSGDNFLRVWCRPPPGGAGGPHVTLEENEEAMGPLVASNASNPNLHRKVVPLVQHMRNYDHMPTDTVPSVLEHEDVFAFARRKLAVSTALREP